MKPPDLLLKITEPWPPSLSIADSLVYVHTILGSFFAGTKIVPVRASVHTQEQRFRHDFRNEAMLRRAE